MSNWQLYFLTAGWGVAAIIITAGWYFSHSERLKGTTIGNILGGFIAGIYFTFHSIGAGAAIAVMWVGILKMGNMGKSIFEVASDNVYDLIFIVVLSPIIGMLFITFLILDASRDEDINK